MSMNEIAQEAFDIYQAIEFELIFEDIAHVEVRIALRMAEMAYHSAEYEIYNNL